MDKSVIVSVRLPEAELRRLQLLAQVYERSVGELIRVAVGKHVEELTRTEEFKTRGLELQRRNEQMLNEFLEASGAIASRPKVVRSMPREVPASKLSKLTVADPARVDEGWGSLINLEILPTVGYAELGAAASHKASKPKSTQRRFTLAWKQGEHEWSMEGLSVGDSHELVLSSRDGLQPGSITWKNSATGVNEVLPLKASNDGRILISGISLSKALKRVESVRDTVDEAQRREMLPIVHMAGEAP